MNNNAPVPQQDPLAQLVDIHLPEQVGLWPPAAGWWILGLLLLVSLIYATIKTVQLIRRNRYRREAINSLNRYLQRYWLEQADSSLNASSLFLSRFNALLKQVAITAFSRPKVSALSQHHWVRFLDKTANIKDFTEGTGKVLAEDMYRPQIETDITALHKLGIEWIKKHRLKYND